MKDWQERARAARKLIRGVKYGNRENTLASVANGYDVNTIRREIRALDFLDVIKADFPKLGQSLDEEVLSSLEMLARWYDSDKKAAIKAARKLVAGKLNFTSLQSAMDAAKSVKASSGSNTGAAAITQLNTDAIGALLGGRLTATKAPKRTSGSPTRLLFSLEREGAASETVAAIVVGPYANAKLYHKRRGDWLWRGLGMAWQFDHVVLLLPSPHHLDEYRSWLSDALLDVETAVRTAEFGKAIVRLPSVRVLAVEVPQ
jgi:hypothetical protein